MKLAFEKNVCLIVDAYSTGKGLAKAINARGYACIHIKSSRDLPERYKHDENDFVESLIYDGNIQSILEKLQHYNIKLCLPGYESGVLLANLLCAELSLPGNDCQYVEAHRDKNRMMDLVAKKLPTIKQFVAHTLQEAFRQRELIKTSPVVLKPLDSANGDGVFFCFNTEDITSAFNTIINSKNQFGKQNAAVLIEEYNDGQEYIVNTVSWAELICIAEVWKVTRIPNTTIYDTVELVDSSDEAWLDITNYTKGVLEALHIKYGAATTELKYKKGRGALLLETSSRLIGGAPLSLSQEAMGFSQLSLLLDAYLDNEIFQFRIATERKRLSKYAMAVCLISRIAGKMKKNIAVMSFYDLQTLHGYCFNAEKGKFLQETTDSLTSPGEIYLSGFSQELIKEDVVKIRQIEKTHLYSDAVGCSTLGLLASKQRVKNDVPVNLEKAYSI